jgi:glycerophosphoryl diester phosphodiesterase
MKDIRLIIVVLILLLFSNSYAKLIAEMSNAAAIKASDKAVILESISPDVNSLKTISVGCRFKTAKPPKNPFVFVSVKGCRLAADKNTGGVYFAVDGLNASLSGIAATNSIRGYSNICDGKWHYIMGVYDGESLAIYVDGVMEDIIDASGTIVSDSHTAAIGQTSGEISSVYYIGDVRIYDEAVEYETIAKLSKNKPARKQVRCRKIDLQKDFLDKGVIPIQAHRGGGFSLPEHTLETYRQTWAMGIIPEVDMRTTKDDVIICMHDDNAKRVAPDTPAPLNKMRFKEMTLKQIKTLDVGAFRNQPGQKVPTLEEVFAEMCGRPEKKVELDYKDIDFKQLADLVNKYNLREQAFFVSREHNLICKWQQISPGSITMIWMGGSEHTLTKIFEQLRRDNFAGISILQIIVFKDEKSADGFRPSMTFLKARKAELDKRGIAMQVIPWEIPDKKIFERFLAEGFRFFGTDYPQAMLEAYKENLKKE